MRSARGALFLALLLAPGALAGWSSHGQREPSTPEDVDTQWPEAGGREPSQVYFNAFPTVAGLGANPNAATLGTRVEPAPAVRWEAVLGVWRDCNRDGAIGLAESAVETYPAPLLLDAAVCPPGGAHHDGETIRELLPVGPDGRAWLVDPAARVWGDVGQPGESGHEGCRVAPLPRGTTAHTGRLVRAADCASEHRLIGAVNTVDNDGGLGLAFDDPHRPEESGSALARPLPVSLYGDPRTGQHGFLEEDAPPAASVRACEGANVEPAATPTQASLWSALALAADETLGDCDPGTGTPLDVAYVSLEGDVEATVHDAKERNDLVLAFGVVEAPGLALRPWSLATPRVPGGLEPQLRWRALDAQLGHPAVLARGSLQAHGGTWWSFYAAVGPATRDVLSLPPGSGRYGNEACGAQTEGTRAGWSCDPARWWGGADGDTMPRGPGGRELGARVGDAYALRDVDCLDGGLGGTGLYASAAFLSARTCVPPG